MKAFLVVLGTHTLSLSILHPSHPQPSHSHLCPLTHTHQPENYEAQLVELHKAKAGYTPSQAESEFLQAAKLGPATLRHVPVCRTSEQLNNQIRECLHSPSAIGTYVNNIHRLFASCAFNRKESGLLAPSEHSYRCCNWTPVHYVIADCVSWLSSGCRLEVRALAQLAFLSLGNSRVFFFLYFFLSLEVD